MKNPPKTFHLITLGCPKNRVDAEILWAALAREGLAAVDDPSEAEVILVNSCAFIRPAVQESIDTILSLADHKRTGVCRWLVVAGCLPPRYGPAISSLLPEVDLFIGPGEIGDIGRFFSKASAERFHCERPSFMQKASTPRVNSLSKAAAYLKVAEGCSRRCSFCTIPKIRGRTKSRELRDLLSEARQLARHGIREIILVAQDLSSWGSDLKSKPTLADLVEALSSISDLSWIRLMYVFPGRLSKRLIRCLADQKNVLPYLDIPMQHADEGVLRRMNRGGSPQSLLRIVSRLRAEIPGVVLRTSLMTGFPGEDERAFSHLVEFVESARFERLGVFAFSKEEGTPAGVMAGCPPAKVAVQRKAALLSLQRKIAIAYHQSLLGTTQEVLIERSAGKNWIGRMWNQAPEVDGVTLVHGRASEGSIQKVHVTKAGPYDLECRSLENGNESEYSEEKSRPPRGRKGSQP
jgi:ribosomal protein S12 methylthiotransferase